MVGEFWGRPSILVTVDGDRQTLIFDPASGMLQDTTGRAQFSVDQGYFTVNKGLTIAEWLQELGDMPLAPEAT